jgi:hypothetical protein
VFHFSSDEESGVDHISAILGEQLVAVGMMEDNNQILSTPEAASIPTIQGPFNPQFFLIFPVAGWILALVMIFQMSKISSTTIPLHHR